MDPDTAEFLLKFYIGLLLLIILIFFIIFFQEADEEQQPLNEVLTSHECKKGHEKCYSIDRNVIKIYCPFCAEKEVNGIFI